MVNTHFCIKPGEDDPKVHIAFTSTKKAMCGKDFQKTKSLIMPYTPDEICEECLSCYKGQMRLEI
jgi:hypothetical protein